MSDRFLDYEELKNYTLKLNERLKGRLEWIGEAPLRISGVARTDWNDLITISGSPSLIGNVFRLVGTGTGDYIEIDNVRYFHDEYIIVTNEVDADDTGTLSEDITIMKFGGGQADIDGKTILNQNDDGTYAQLHTRVGGWLDRTDVSSNTKTTTLTDTESTYTFTDTKMDGIWGVKAPAKVTVTITEKDTTTVILDMKLNIAEVAGWENTFSFSTADIGFVVTRNPGVDFTIKMIHHTAAYSKEVDVVFTVDASVIHHLDTDYIKINEDTIAAEKVISTDEVKTIRAKSAIEVAALSTITNPLTETIYRLTAEETISGKKYAKGLYVYDISGATPVWVSVGGNELDEKTILSNDDGDASSPVHTAIGGYKTRNSSEGSFFAANVITSDVDGKLNGTITEDETKINPLLENGYLTTAAKLHTLWFEPDGAGDYVRLTDCYISQYPIANDKTFIIKSENTNLEIVFTPNDTNYIIAINVSNVGLTPNTMYILHFNVYKYNYFPIDNNYVATDNVTIIKNLNTSKTNDVLRAKSAIATNKLSTVSNPIDETLYRLTENETIGTTLYKAGLYVYDSTLATPSWIFVGSGTIPDGITIRDNDDTGAATNLRTVVGGGYSGMIDKYYTFNGSMPVGDYNDTYYYDYSSLPITVDTAKYLKITYGYMNLPAGGGSWYRVTLKSQILTKLSNTQYELRGYYSDGSNTCYVWWLFDTTNLAKTKMKTSRQLTGNNSRGTIAVRNNFQYIDSDFINVDNESIYRDSTSGLVGKLHSKSAIETDKLSTITNPLIETIYRLTTEEIISDKKYVPGLYVYDTSKTPHVWISVGTPEVDEKTILSTDGNNNKVPLHTKVGGWYQKEFVESVDYGTQLRDIAWFTFGDVYWDTTFNYPLMFDGTKPSTPEDYIIVDYETAEGNKYSGKLNYIGETNEAITYASSTGTNPLSKFVNWKNGDNASLYFLANNINDDLQKSIAISYVTKETIHYIDSDYINVDNKSIRRTDGVNMESKMLYNEVYGYTNDNSAIATTLAPYNKDVTVTLNSEYNINMVSFTATPGSSLRMFSNCKPGSHILVKVCKSDDSAVVDEIDFKFDSSYDSSNDYFQFISDSRIMPNGKKCYIRSTKSSDTYYYLTCYFSTKADVGNYVLKFYPYESTVTGIASEYIKIDNLSILNDKTTSTGNVLRTAVGGGKYISTGMQYTGSNTSGTFNYDSASSLSATNTSASQIFSVSCDTDMARLIFRLKTDSSGDFYNDIEALYDKSKEETDKKYYRIINKTSGTKSNFYIVVTKINDSEETITASFNFMSGEYKSGTVTGDAELILIQYDKEYINSEFVNVDNETIYVNNQNKLSAVATKIDNVTLKKYSDDAIYSAVGGGWGSDSEITKSDLFRRGQFRYEIPSTSGFMKFVYENSEFNNRQIRYIEAESLLIMDANYNEHIFPAAEYYLDSYDSNGYSTFYDINKKNYIIVKYNYVDPSLSFDNSSTTTIELYLEKPSSFVGTTLTGYDNFIFNYTYHDIKYINNRFIKVDGNTIVDTANGFKSLSVIEIFTLPDVGITNVIYHQTATQLGGLPEGYYLYDKSSSSYKNIVLIDDNTVKRDSSGKLTVPFDGVTIAKNSDNKFESRLQIYETLPAINTVPNYKIIRTTADSTVDGKLKSASLYYSDGTVWKSAGEVRTDGVSIYKDEYNDYLVAVGRGHEKSEAEGGSYLVKNFYQSGNYATNDYTWSHNVTWSWETVDWFDNPNIDVTKDCYFTGYVYRRWQSPYNNYVQLNIPVKAVYDPVYSTKDIIVFTAPDFNTYKTYLRVFYNVSNKKIGVAVENGQHGYFRTLYNYNHRLNIDLHYRDSKLSIQTIPSKYIEKDNVSIIDDRYGTGLRTAIGGGEGLKLTSHYIDHSLFYGADTITHDDNQTVFNMQNNWFDPLQKTNKSEIKLGSIIMFDSIDFRTTWETIYKTISGGTYICTEAIDDTHYKFTCSDTTKTYDYFIIDITNTDATGLLTGNTHKFSTSVLSTDDYNTIVGAAGNAPRHLFNNLKIYSNVKEYINNDYVKVDNSTISVNANGELKANYSYGTALPTTGTEGQVYFLIT